MESAKKDAQEQYTERKSEGKSSRDAMLDAIKQNQPEFVSLPNVPLFQRNFDDVVLKYIDVLTGIGGQVYTVESYNEIIHQLNRDFADAKRIVSFDASFSAIADIETGSNTLHQFQDVDVCITTSKLAVAENGAIWITDKEMPERVLPFITQSLVVVIHKNNIVATMHEAYDIIADADYGFAVFIAGPSKTADIEQSLVLGAHGPKTMTVFIME